MGVEPYLLAASINLILAQRLVRRICNSCKEEDVDSKDLLARLDFEGHEGHQEKIYAGKGCRDCEFTGYYGRVAIYEMLPINRDLRKMIVERAPDDIMRDYAQKNGMATLRDTALKKVFQGVTTVQEALGVTQT